MLEINNLTNGYPLGPVDKKSFSQVAKIILKGENRETENISLAFVKKEEMKKLNKKFRKKNKATDVLSFNLGERDYLGEIVICPDIVKKNAKKYGTTAKKEMMKVFVHGVLHLLGYDHPDEIEDPRRSRDEESKDKADEMEEKQNFYLSNI